MEIAVLYTYIYIYKHIAYRQGGLEGAEVGGGDEGAHALPGQEGPQLRRLV